MSRYFNYTGDDYVAHFGIKGQKWGVRRYQNNNGSLTPTGKTRYLDKPSRQSKLEAKYQQKGKSKAEAEAAAKKRIKIEKIIAATAGIELGIAIAYGLIDKYQKSISESIKTNSMQPLHQDITLEGFKPKTFKPESFKPEGFNFKTFRPD